MAMLWVILLILVCGFCNSQQFKSNYNGTEGVTDCIRDFADLEAYIISNRKLVEKLAETFFTTKRGASKFVKITYNFQTNKAGIQPIEDNITNCSTQQGTYIWSETALYFLGPKALYWLTLFAVNIHEVDVTVELPCLCNEVYNSFLSRLTYLIKVYAVTKYQGPPLQFANKYYFQVKSTMDDDNYKIIIIIMILMTILPLTLMFAITPFIALHIYPIVRRLIKTNKVKVDPNFYLDSGIYPIAPKGESHYKKLIHMRPLIFTSVGICLCLIVIHVFSAVRFIQYGMEVLGYKNHHNKIPIIHTVLSVLAIIIGYVLIAISLKIIISAPKSNIVESENNPSDPESGNNSNDELRVLQIPAAMISMNFIYVVCYFLPYMLLAFINDPVLTIYTYLTLAFFIVCVYLICLGVWHLYKYKRHKEYADKDKFPKFLDTLQYSCMTWAMAVSILVFLCAMTNVITLGSFDDYEELKLLTPSLLIAFSSLFLLKPVFMFISKKVKETSSKNKETPSITKRENEGTSTFNRQQNHKFSCIHSGQFKETLKRQKHDVQIEPTPIHIQLKETSNDGQEDEEHTLGNVQTSNDDGRQEDEEHTPENERVQANATENPKSFLVQHQTL